MKITGRYIVDDNFTTVFTTNAMYVIANNNCDWSCLHIGEHTAMGILLSRELFNNLKSQAILIGTFEID